MKRALFFIFLFLIGCSTNMKVTPAFTMGNNQIYKATCNWSNHDITDCYQLASQYCGGRFNVVKELQNSDSAVVWGDVVTVDTKRSVLFYCY